MTNRTGPGRGNGKRSACLLLIYATGAATSHVFPSAMLFMIMIHDVSIGGRGHHDVNACTTSDRPTKLMNERQSHARNGGFPSLRGAICDLRYAVRDPCYRASCKRCPERYSSTGANATHDCTIWEAWCDRCDVRCAMCDMGLMILLMLLSYPVLQIATVSMHMSA